MRIMTSDAGSAHEHGRDQTNAVAQDRPRYVGQFLIRTVAQRGEGRCLKIVEGMRRPVLERKVRHKPVGKDLLLLADRASEFERERRWYWYGSRRGLVIMHHLRPSVPSANPADDGDGV